MEAERTNSPTRPHVASLPVWKIALIDFGKRGNVSAAIPRQ